MQGMNKKIVKKFGIKNEISYFCNATLAQLVEQLTLNQLVGGSSPPSCTN